MDKVWQINVFLSKFSFVIISCEIFITLKIHKKSRFGIETNSDFGIETNSGFGIETNSGFGIETGYGVGLETNMNLTSVSRRQEFILVQERKSSLITVQDG